jgi:hypothetical protein
MKKARVLPTVFGTAALLLLLSHQKQAMAMTVSAGACSSSVIAVNYSPGWHIVSGAGMACVTGRVSVMLEYLDGQYQVASPARLADPLSALWVYFPDGATVALPADLPNGSGIDPENGSLDIFTTSLDPDGWYLVGNPSPYGPESFVTGIDDAVLYDDGNYVTTTAIPPGQGAWIYVSSNGPHIMSPSMVRTKIGVAVRIPVVPQP